MTHDQIVIVAVIAATMAMFLWGRWRHDMVALAALIACVVSGLVPTRAAFLGFGHPAVITVAIVLILGPGGFRFGDYWRMGLPTDILVVAVSVPMLLWVWPL